MPNFGRVVYTVGETEYSIGYHQWVSFSCESNPQSKVIPRARGVAIYSGEEMGGGLLRIKLQIFIEKTTREELESYIYDLMVSIINTKGTLTVSRGDNTLTLENCYFQSMSQPDDCGRTCVVGLEFLKSF